MIAAVAREGCNLIKRFDKNEKNLDEIKKEVDEIQNKVNKLAKSYGSKRKNFK